MSVAVLGLLVLTFVAVAGAAIGILLGSVAPKRLELLVHVATGTLLGITVFDILPEAKMQLSWGVFVPIVAAGYALLWAVGRFVYHVCPSCAIAHMDHDSPLRDGRQLLMLGIALGVHCALDGVAVVAGGELPAQAGIGVLLGVGMHKLPEGLALGLLLAGAGMTKRSGILRAASIESLTAVGGLLSIAFVREAPAGSIGATFALVGGGFLYLVINALSGALGHRMQMSRVKGLATQCISCAGTGAVLWVLDRCFE